MTITIDREMTITHDDFFRILPNAINEFIYEIHGDTIICHTNTSQIEINVTKKESKKLGALNLPVLQVKFVLKNISEETKNRFFEKFDFAFQKGGG